MKMIDLIADQIIRYDEEFQNASSDIDRIDLYKKTKEPIQQLYLHTMPYSRYDSYSPSSYLITFFNNLHNSSCNYGNPKLSKCVASS